MNDLLVDLRSQRAALIATMVRDGYGGDSLRKLADLQGSIAAIEAVLRRLANNPAKPTAEIG